MATRNIVPRANGEGSIGTAAKHWGAGHFDTLPNWQEYLAESTGYGIVSGCEPTISGLTVTVGAGIVHLADGTRKELSATNVTLDSADSTNPRIDLVYIDSTGAVTKITGTATANPSVPALPSGGISVAQVSVAAGATAGTFTDSRDFALVTNKNVMTIKEARISRIDAGSITTPLTACHRGYQNGDDFRAIENTIFALGDAERAGFQGVEIDFRKDVNGQIVCLHDATVDRVTNGSGNIADIDYTTVYLLDKYGRTTSNYLTTIEQMVTMAKMWNMWLIVDGSKNICTIPELMEIFDLYDYKNYIFFEYENDSESEPEDYYRQYLNTPKGTRMVLDPPSHSITSSTLDTISNLFADRIDDIYIRTAYSVDEQYFPLIKSYGFKIMHNTGDNILYPPTIPQVDVILSEESIYQRYPSKLIAKSNSMQGAFDDAVKETLSTFMVKPKTGTITDWPWGGINNACGMQYRNDNGNYGFQLGFAFEETIVYRNRRDGAFGKWRTPLDCLASETGIPTSGTYQKGDIIKNPNPTAGGYIGWVCVTAGTPGTWKGFGLIES